MPETTDTATASATTEPEANQPEPLAAPDTDTSKTKTTGYQPLEQGTTKAKPRGKYKPVTYTPYDHDEQ